MGVKKRRIWMEKKAAKTTVKTVVKTDKAASPGGWYSQAYKVGNLIYILSESTYLLLHIFSYIFTVGA